MRRPSPPNPPSPRGGRGASGVGWAGRPPPPTPSPHRGRGLPVAPAPVVPLHTGPGTAGAASHRLPLPLRGGKGAGGLGVTRPLFPLFLHKEIGVRPHPNPLPGGEGARRARRWATSAGAAEEQAPRAVALRVPWFAAAAQCRREPGLTGQPLVLGAPRQGGWRVAAL